MDYHKRSVTALDSILPTLRTLLGMLSFMNFFLCYFSRDDPCTTHVMFFLFPLHCINLDESELQPVYGCPLDDHLRIQEREIAFVLEECVTFLHREAMDVQVSQGYFLTLSNKILMLAKISA